MPSRRRRAQASYSSLIWPQTDDTVDLEIAAWSPSASARAASTSLTDRPRTNEAITSDSSAFVFVTCDPNSRDANASVVPRSFGRDSCTGPSAVLKGTYARLHLHRGLDVTHSCAQTNCSVHASGTTGQKTARARVECA